MVTLAEVLLAIAALGGIVLAIGHLRGSRPPLVLALVHGLLGAAGLISIIAAMVKGVSGTAILVSLILFVIAALGGFVLFSFRLRGKALPKGPMMIHGLVAVVGFIVLLAGVR